MIKILITGISLKKDCGSNPCMTGVLGLAYIPVPLLLKGVEAQQQIITGVQSVLADFEDCLSLDLLQISQAIAYINAKKITLTYTEMHSQVIKEDLAAYSREVGEMFLRSTQSTVSNQDFLKQQGFQTSPTSVKDTLKKVQQLTKQH